MSKIIQFPQKINEKQIQDMLNLSNKIDDLVQDADKNGLNMDLIALTVASRLGALVRAVRIIDNEDILDLTFDTAREHANKP